MCGYCDNNNNKCVCANLIENLFSISALCHRINKLFIANKIFMSVEKLKL
jgi:hypothetical protein